jgi:hypothetical protein
MATACTGEIGPRPMRASERLALEQRHYDEYLAVGLLDIVDRTDVRMARERSGTSFVQEATPQALVH